MSEPLGLSIGVANLVAVRAGGAPVTRSSVLTLFDDRPSEVGLPEENPNLTEPGLVIRGFVERVGDRNPLVAADGTKYVGDALMVEALEALARTVGYGSPITIAVPAYWSDAQSAAVRSEFFAQPGLAAEGVTPVLISDATAGLAALRSKPGFPTDGFVALCDFGAGGTTVTLTNGRSNFQQIGQSVRYTDFSGETIDQLVANYVRSGGQDAATSTNLAAARPVSPTLLGECRRAKEQLSGGTVATIATGTGADFRLSRTELEQLISAPLDQFVATLAEVLQRNGIPHASLAAVATLGGGASIPLVTARLSERLRVRVLTTPEPMFSAAIGATVLGAQQLSAGAATAAGAAVELPTELVSMPETEALPNQDAETGKPAYGLAWSQDSATGEEPVPYTGPEHTGGYGVEATGRATAPEDRRVAEDRRAAEPGPLPWYKRTALVVSVVAAIAAVLLAVVLALTVGHGKTNPVNTTPKEPTPSQTPQTVTITGPNNSPTTTVITPPTTQSPASTTTQPPASPTTTTQPPTTTTTHTDDRRPGRRPRHRLAVHNRRRRQPPRRPPVVRSGPGSGRLGPDPGAESVGISLDPRALVGAASGLAQFWLRTTIKTQQQLLSLLEDPVDDPPTAVSAQEAPPSESLGAKMRGLLDRALDQSTSGSQVELFHHILDQLVADEARIIGALSDGSSSPLVNVYDWTRRRDPGSRRARERRADRPDRERRAAGDGPHLRQPSAVARSGRDRPGGPGPEGRLRGPDGGDHGAAMRSRTRRADRWPPRSTSSP